MKIELHLIQNFAPSCLNRDDTNSPKDCDFGGYRRARISSQCLKRAIRTSPTFAEILPDNLGKRTKALIRLLKDKLIEMGHTENEIDLVVPLFVEKYSGLDNGQKTKVLLYLGFDEITRMAKALASHWEEIVTAVQNAAQSESDATKEKKGKKEKNSIADNFFNEIATAATGATKAADIALFGRMVAEKPDENIDAACQVAHAFSTNRMNMEMDFFTAVDDVLKETEQGAGMMGIIEFNSACFYRYSLIDFDQLVKNLSGDNELALTTVEAFVKASIEAIPTGKQSSMAAHNSPSLVMAVVREKGSPRSLANAFVKPVFPGRSETDDLISKSIFSFDKYWGDLTRMYGESGIKGAAVCVLGDLKLQNLEDKKVDGVERIVKSVREVLA
jgi:CRISPR system Cascade subunit CasC